MEQNSFAKISLKYSCVCCDYNTSRKQDYENHIITRIHKKRTLEQNGNDISSNTGDSAEIYTCQQCNYNTLKKKDFEKHNLSNKHVKNIEIQTKNDNLGDVKNAAGMYSCNLCDYNTDKKWVFEKHKLSKKHVKNVENQTKNDICKLCNTCIKCDKSFASSSGLWKHKRKCNQNKEEPTQDNEGAKLSNAFLLFNEMIKSHHEMVKTFNEMKNSFLERNVTI